MICFRPFNNCSSYLNSIEDYLIHSNQHARNLFLSYVFPFFFDFDQSEFSSQWWFSIRSINFHHNDKIFLTMINVHQSEKVQTMIKFTQWLISIIITIFHYNDYFIKKMNFSHNERNDELFQLLWWILTVMNFNHNAEFSS